MLSWKSTILQSVSYPQTEVNHFSKSGTWNLGDLLIILMNIIDCLQCIVHCYLPINSLPQSTEKSYEIFFAMMENRQENVQVQLCPSLLLSLYLVMDWSNFLMVDMFSFKKMLFHCYNQLDHGKYVSSSSNPTQGFKLKIILAFQLIEAEWHIYASVY